MSFSNYLEAGILNHIFGLATFNAPTWYVALSTADPGEDGSGIAEPTASEYARQALGSVTISGSEISNLAAVTFATALEVWGTISHVALFDAASGGNFLGSNALTGGSQAIGIDDAMNFPIGDIKITQD
jgi:hypothetical protein